MPAKHKSNPLKARAALNRGGPVSYDWTTLFVELDEIEFFVGDVDEECLEVFFTYYEVKQFVNGIVR